MEKTLKILKKVIGKIKTRGQIESNTWPPWKYLGKGEWEAIAERVFEDRKTSYRRK